MRAALDRLLHPRRRRHGPAVSPSNRPASAPRHDDAQRQVARELAEALDDALRHHRRHQVSVLAESALRIAHKHPLLTERLARLRLADDDADAALDLIEASAEQTASLRLLRNVCLLQVGRRAEAHHDLCRWTDEGEDPAPMDARVMLALLDWEAGDRDCAIAHLLDNIAQFETGDERTLTALTCLAVERGRIDQAAQWARRLRQCTWQRPGAANAELIIASLNLPESFAVQPTSHQLDALAMELIAAEPAVGALVDALELEPDRAAAEMLVAGLERALPDLASPPAAIEALARLEVQLGRDHRALHWIDRGLSISPMSAALMLLKRQLDPAATDRPTTADDVDAPPLALPNTTEQRRGDDTRSKAA